ncbi:MAG: capsular biosynthesis protein [Lachnospiraceae bacterium]|nr:capsular biosynthesis protein [Lachnospiraceae bacterium]
MTGYYDVHCHIIPEVDDGSADMKTAMELLRREYADGVRVIYLTPHYRSGMFETPRPQVIRQYKLLREKAKLHFRDLKLRLGCEFHANQDMISMLQSEKGYTMGSSSCVLVEFSRSHSSMVIRERCSALLAQGYQPVVAHAERYPVLTGNIALMHSLHHMGVRFQINAQSILGKNGLALKLFCRRLMKEDLIDLVGSDAHDLSERKPMMGSCAEYVRRKMGSEYMEKLFISNPKTILKGRKKKKQ